MEFWERILDRYGLPVLVIIALAWAGYKITVKLLLPYMRRQDERIQEQHAAMVNVLNAQLNEAREIRTTEVAKFTRVIENSLGEYSQNQRAVAENMRLLAERVGDGRKDS